MIRRAVRVALAVAQALAEPLRCGVCDQPSDRPVCARCAALIGAR